MHYSVIIIKKLNIINFELLKNTKSFQSNLIPFVSFHLLIFRFSLIDRYMNYIVQRSSYFVHPR